MARKRTKGLPASGKRTEMRNLEKELRRSGFRPLFWRTHGKRLLKLFILCVLLFGFFCGAKWLWENHVRHYDAFAIEHLEYYSNGLMDESTALELMGYNRADSMLTIETDVFEQRLLEHSAVKLASVKRKLPSTLVVEVDMRVPVAWLHCPGLGVRAYDPERGMYIDADSHVFTGIKDVYEPYQHVPLLQVPPPPEGIITPGNKIESLENGILLIKLLKQGNKEGFPLVRLVKVRNEWSYSVEFDDGCQVLFGVFDMNQQVDRYFTIMEDAKNKQKRVKFLNLLMKRNIVVEYDEGYDEIPMAEPGN